MHLFQLFNWDFFVLQISSRMRTSQPRPLPSHNSSSFRSLHSMLSPSPFHHIFITLFNTTPQQTNKRYDGPRPADRPTTRVRPAAGATQLQFHENIQPSKGLTSQRVKGEFIAKREKSNQEEVKFGNTYKMDHMIWIMERSRSEMMIDRRRDWEGSIGGGLYCLI